MIPTLPTWQIMTRMFSVFSQWAIFIIHRCLQIRNNSLPSVEEFKWASWTPQNDSHYLSLQTCRTAGGIYYLQPKLGLRDKSEIEFLTLPVFAFLLPLANKKSATQPSQAPDSCMVQKMFFFMSPGSLALKRPLVGSGYKIAKKKKMWNATLKKGGPQRALKYSLITFALHQSRGQFTIRSHMLCSEKQNWAQALPVPISP